MPDKSDSLQDALVQLVEASRLVLDELSEEKTGWYFQLLTSVGCAERALLKNQGR